MQQKLNLNLPECENLCKCVCLPIVEIYICVYIYNCMIPTPCTYNVYKAFIMYICMHIISNISQVKTIML